MSLPVPKPGLVIRYGFLWSREAARGAEEGPKDRPCTIVVATRRDKHDDIRVIVAPVTHEPPTDPTLPSKSRQRSAGDWGTTVTVIG